MTDNSASTLNWVEDDKSFSDLAKTTNATLRSLYHFTCGKETLISEIFFEGSDFMWCTEGAFHFKFSDREDVILKEGEFLVMFPNRFVTISGLTKKNSIEGGILEGKLNEELLLRIGLWDCFQCPAAYASDNAGHLQKILDQRKTDPTAEVAVLRYLSHILKSVIAARSVGRERVFYEATRLLNTRFLSSNPSAKFLPEELKCSPPHLIAVFKEHGYKGPGEYLSRLQSWRACQLLKYSRYTQVQIANICGYSSSTSFVRFLTNWIGVSPSDVRAGKPFKRHPRTADVPRSTDVPVR